MTSPQDFMMTFAKEIIHNTDTRPQIVQQWTEKLEAREAELGRQFYERFESELGEPFHSYDEHRDVYDAIDVMESAKKAACIEE